MGAWFSIDAEVTEQLMERVRARFNAAASVLRAVVQRDQPSRRVQVQKTDAGSRKTATTSLEV